MSTAPCTADGPVLPRALTAATLARLTPVSLVATPPVPFIAWGDLEGMRFADPFFDQTIARWTAGQPHPNTLRTPLDALAEFDHASGRDPCGLIFHMSRCGSTLLSRLLATMTQTLVISEPQPLNALLATAAGADEAALADVLRNLIRALGCRRFGEQFYVLKLSSWNIRLLPVFRRAFPAARIVFVQRAPAEVMASMHADPPGWLALRQYPVWAELLFDGAAGANQPPDDDEVRAQSLKAILAAARDAADRGALIVDYNELPAAAWRRVAAFLGITLTADDVTRMQDEQRYYAKDAGRRLFTGDPPERRPRDPRRDALAAEIVEPVYRHLDDRRRAQIAMRGVAGSAPPLEYPAPPTAPL